MGRRVKNEREFEVSRLLSMGWRRSALIASYASRRPFPSGLALAALIILLTFASLLSSFLTLGYATVSVSSGSSVTLGHASPDETTRVSVSSSGEEGNGGSEPFFSPSQPSISADGRFVVFYSSASNLVPGDTNGFDDLFLHDRQTGITSRVTDSSIAQNLEFGSSHSSISADGRFAAYSFGPVFSYGSVKQIFIYDRQAGSTSQLHVDGSGGVTDVLLHPAMSADGRYVAYDAVIRLEPGDPFVNASRIFVHDRQAGSTTLVSGNSLDFSQNPSISADGRYVAFHSNKRNLVAGDTNSTYDVFVYDQQTGGTSRVSLSSSGEEGALPSFSASITADGRYVAFASSAPNLVPGDTNDATDVFVHDRQTGSTTRVSVSSGGDEGSGTNPSISADGRFVMFESGATNLIAGDTNDSVDVFVHDRQTGTTSRVSVASSGEEGDDRSEDAASSADGRYVVFDSDAANLVAGDTNNFDDVFVHERGGPVSSLQSLTVTRSGDGSGTVASTVAGIECGTDCSEDYLSGRLVTLTASPEPGSHFAGWRGGTDWSGSSCSGMGICTVVMTQAHTVTAIFTPLEGRKSLASLRYVRLVADSEVNGNSWASLAELTLLDQNGTPLDQSGWTLQSVNSEELVGENGAAGNAFDGNPATIWHSQWSSGSDTHPHEIVIDLGSVQTISGFGYLPRQDGGVNGQIADYRFYGSHDGMTWGEPLASGTFVNTAEMQQVPFGGIRYLRLVAASEVNNNPYTSVAELNVLDENGMPLDQRDWSLQAVYSEELVGENGAAVNAFDGNPATIWHTEWFNGSVIHPHWMVLDLGSVQTVSGIRYLPRQDGGVNGRIDEYQFYGSSSIATWGPLLAIGNFANTADEQQGVFAGTRYVRLVANSEVNGNPFTTMAELSVLDATGTPLDKSAWTLQSVDSEELVGENGTAVNAFDDNPATIWHNQWTGGPAQHPHEIVIDLGAVHVLGGFRYLPRQDGGVNGRIGQYQFFGSLYGTTWGPPRMSGAFADTDQEQEVLF